MILLKFAVGGVVVAALAVALSGLISQNRLDEELRAFEAKYRAMGYPVTLEELKAAHQVPEGEANAADEYLLAFEKMTDEGIDYGLLPIMGEAEIEPGQPMSREIFTEVSAFLAANEEAFVHLRRAAVIPLCRFPYDFSAEPFVRGMSSTDPYGGTNRSKYMRHTARLLALDAMLAAEVQNADKSIAVIRDILALSEAELQQPDLHSYFVSRAITGIALAQVRTALSTLELTESRLDLLVGAVEHLKQSEDYRRVLLDEYILTEADYTQLDETPIWQGLESWIDPEYWPTAGSVGMYRLGQFDIQDRRAMLQQFQAYLKALDEPMSALPSALAEIEQNGAFSIFWMGDARKSTASTMTGLCKVFLFARAEYDSALTAIAIERFRNAEGSIPGTLRALVPKYFDSVPTDHFAGEPLRFRQNPEGYVVYSVGMDHLDQGGYDFEADESLGDDRAFVVHRP